MLSNVLINDITERMKNMPIGNIKENWGSSYLKGTNQKQLEVAVQETANEIYLSKSLS